MQHFHGEAGASHTHAALREYHGHAARHRIVHDFVGQGVSDGSHRDPELPNVELPKDRSGPSGMVIVIVGQGENLESPASLTCKERCQDPLSDVVPTSGGARGVNEEKASRGAPNENGLALPDIHDLHDARCAWARRKGTQVQKDEDQTEGRPDPSRRGATELVRFPLPTARGTYTFRKSGGKGTDKKDCVQEGHPGSGSTGTEYTPRHGRGHRSDGEEHLDAGSYSPG